MISIQLTDVRNGEIATYCVNANTSQPSMVGPYYLGDALTNCYLLEIDFFFSYIGTVIYNPCQFSVLKTRNDFKAANKKEYTAALNEQEKDTPMCTIMRGLEKLEAEKRRFDSALQEQPLSLPTSLGVTWAVFQILPKWIRVTPAGRVT